MCGSMNLATNPGLDGLGKGQSRWPQYENGGFQFGQVLTMIVVK